MISQLLVFMSSIFHGAISAPPVAHEVVRGTDGVVHTVSNTAVPYGRMRQAILVPGESENNPYVRDWGNLRHMALNHPDMDVSRVAGPIPWGVVEGAQYAASHRRPGRYDPGTEFEPFVSAAFKGTVIDTIIHPLPEIIEMERSRRRGDATVERSRELIDRDWSFMQRYGCRAFPLKDYIVEHAESLNKNWDLRFDVVYTSLEDVTTVAVHRGKLLTWRLHGTGDDRIRWTADTPVLTSINGIFRLLRAGKDLTNLYFIDETGAIHTGFGADHRRIGSIPGYHSEEEGTITLLFEDQMTRKIGILHAARDGSITPLPIEWTEEGFADDFIAELDGEQTTAALRRLAEILREDGEGEGT